MKPSYEELEQQLAESHRALRAETTAHENTQMQLEKMAAENAGLKADIYDMLRQDYGLQGSLVDVVDWQAKRIAELQIARDKCFLSGLKTGWEYGIANETEGYSREVADAQAVIECTAAAGKGE